MCRPPTGSCDYGGFCDGKTTTCPPSKLKAKGTLCRNIAGGCDVAERCLGTSADCPADIVLPATTVCRASTGMCDPAEYCTGASGVCPANYFLPNTTVCRNSSQGLCDAPEFCTGSSGSCPVDTLYPNRTVCRAPAGSCDAAELCNGLSAACPIDQLLPNGTVCRPLAGTCDISEICSGTSPKCPDDIVLPSSTVCRSSAGVCDQAEMCTGTSGVCPSDKLQPPSLICRSSTDACDAPENCTGKTVTCPSDQLRPNGTVCRPLAGKCDISEICSGTSPKCPDDIVLPSSTVCRSSAGVCDQAEMCTGTNAVCPPDLFYPSTTVCRPLAGSCDLSAELCTGTSTTCPIDSVVANGTICRPSSQMCDPAEACDGASGACPFDINPPCPWAWIPAQAPVRLTDGSYCGSLPDGTYISMTMAGPLFDQFIMTPGAGSRTLAWARAFLLNQMPADPELIIDSTSSMISYFQNPLGLDREMTVLDFSNASLTVNFTLTQPPYITGTSTLALTRSSCAQSWEIPAGNYCTSFVQMGIVNSAFLQVLPREDPMTPQTGTLSILNSENKYGSTKYITAQVFFMHYLSLTGDLFFVVDDPNWSTMLSKIAFSMTTGNFIITNKNGNIQLTLSRCQFRSIPAQTHYIDQQWTHQSFGGSPPTVESARLMIRPVLNATNVIQIDLTSPLSFTWTTMTVTLSGPLLTASSIPLELQKFGVTNILCDLSSDQFFVVSTTAVSQTKTFMCSNMTDIMNSHRTFCGSVNSYSYAVRYGISVMNIYGYSGTFVNAGTCFTGMKEDVSGSNTCTLTTTLTPDEACMSKILLSGIVQYTGGGKLSIQVGGQSGTAFPLDAANCYQPPLGLTQYSGTNGLYFAQIAVNGTADADGFVAMSMMLSNATNVLCVATARGIFVLSGTIIFRSIPSGTCDDTKQAVMFNTSVSNYYDRIAISVTGNTSYSGITVPVVANAQAPPRGLYCVDLGSGDFVMIKQNVTGKTTVYASIAGVNSQTTLWTSVNFVGTPPLGFVVNRSTDASGDRPFPVQVVSYTAIQGFGVTLPSGNSAFATMAGCVFDQNAYGTSCGVLSADYFPNGSFGIMTLSVDTSTYVHTLELYASRRVTSSSPTSVSFSHPWLVQFSFPISLRYTSGRSTWTVTVQDSIGPLIIQMRKSVCGSPLQPRSSYCGPVSNGSGSLVRFDVESLNSDGRSMQLNVNVVDATNSQLSRVIQIPTAYVINSSVVYWAGSTVPRVLLTTTAGNGSSVNFTGDFDGVLNPSSCGVLPPQDQFYCGVNGTAPMILSADFTSPDYPTYRLAAATSTGSAQWATVYWRPPVPLSGDITTKSVDGPMKVISMKHLANGTFLVQTSDNAVTRTLAFSRAICKTVTIPDGDYCGYNDTTSQLSFRVTIRNSTVYANVSTSQKNLYRMQCIGGQSSGGGAYVCTSKYIIPNDFDPPGTFGISENAIATGSAVVSYAGTTLTVSFSASGGGLQRLTKAACSTFPELFRSFNRSAVMTSPNFSSNTRIAVNASGTLFVADANRNCIFTVDPNSGFVSLFTGRCDEPGFQDGPSSEAMFNNTAGIVFDSFGLLYVLDSGNARVRVVAPDGTVSTSTGSGNAASVDGSGSGVSYLDLAGVAIHPTSGRLYISEAYRIRILNQATSTVKTFIGGTSPGYAVGSTTKALVNQPGKPAFAADLSMYFFDSGNSCLRKVSNAGAVTTVANQTVDPLVGYGGPAPSLVDSIGNVLILLNSSIFVFATPSGVLSRYSGSQMVMFTPNATDLAISPSTGTMYVGDGQQIYAFLH